jgi:hypothetical protein
MVTYENLNAVSLVSEDKAGWMSNIVSVCFFNIIAWNRDTASHLFADTSPTNISSVE